jgi:hypothetical protein
MSGGKTSSVFQHKHLWLYKQRASRCWQMRVTLNGKTKVRSSGTTDLKLAEELAEEFFLECATKSDRGERANAPSSRNVCRFDRLADDNLNLKRPDLCDREWKNLRNLLVSPFGPAAYFRGKDVGDISTEDVRSYLRHAEEHSSKGKLSPFTLKRHVSAISGVLRLAAERQLIASVPLMPRIKTKDQPRGYFTQPEYRFLCSTAHSLAQRSQTANDALSAAEWGDLGDLIAFLVNCLLRPSEWPDLHQRDVVVHRSGATPHLVISLRKGKTGARLVHSMPAGVKIFDRIIARSGDDPDAHLFFNRYSNRATAQEKAGRLFRRLLDETGLRLDGFGRPRTLYSLRHTALMLRLEKSDGTLDLLTLAKAAGTSIGMIERFYCSHHAPGMKLAALQSFKRPPGR